MFRSIVRSLDRSVVIGSFLTSSIGLPQILQSKGCATSCENVKRSRSDSCFRHLNYFHLGVRLASQPHTEKCGKVYFDCPFCRVCIGLPQVLQSKGCATSCEDVKRSGSASYVRHFKYFNLGVRLASQPHTEKRGQVYFGYPGCTVC